MAFWPFLVLQVTIFAGLVFMLRRILSRNLTDATAHLQSLNAEYTRRHEELKRRLEEAEQQYKEQIAKARVESDQLMSQARQEAESSKVRLLGEARSESERIVQQALESRDAMRKEVEQIMEQRAIERACELLQETLPGQLRQEIQSHWLDELIHNGLSHVSRMRAEEPVHEVRVVSALPLSSEQRVALAKRLKEKFGQELPVKETTDERLVVGLVITLGSLVLDGSLASKLRQAARHAQHLS